MIFGQGPYMSPHTTKPCLGFDVVRATSFILKVKTNRWDGECFQTLIGMEKLCTFSTYSDTISEEIYRSTFSPNLPNLKMP